MISIDPSCNLCGLCTSVCVRRNLEPGEDRVRVLDPDICLSCGHCKAVCPTNAPHFSHLNEAEFEAIPDKKEWPDPQAFLKFLRRRRSLRVYQDRPVEKEKLKLIVEAGRFAPTGGNRQACEYVVVSGRRVLDRVCTAAIRALQERGAMIRETVERHRRSGEPLPEDIVSNQAFPQVWDRIARKWTEGVDQLFHHAPAFILIHSKKGVSTIPETDAAIASTHMVLMAETLGLGTCFIGFLIAAANNSAEVRHTLQVPSDHQALVSFTLGYPRAKYLRLVARNPAKTLWLE
jgi:nitroreductase/NAD-dependent dihydropyrimidine dehydrogenase PreA subunit